MNGCFSPNAGTGAGVETKENGTAFVSFFCSELLDAKLTDGVETRAVSTGAGAGVPPNEMTAAALVGGLFAVSCLGSFTVGTGITVAPNVNPPAPVGGAPDADATSVPNLKPPVLGAGADTVGLVPKRTAGPEDAAAGAGGLPKVKPPEPIEPLDVVPTLATGAAPKVKPPAPIDPLRALPLSFSAAATSVFVPRRGVSQDGHLISFGSFLQLQTSHFHWYACSLNRSPHPNADVGDADGATSLLFGVALPSDVLMDDLSNAAMAFVSTYLGLT